MNRRLALLLAPILLLTVAATACGEGGSDPAPAATSDAAPEGEATAERDDEAVADAPPSDDAPDEDPAEEPAPEADAPPPDDAATEPAADEQATVLAVDFAAHRGTRYEGVPAQRTTIGFPDAPVVLTDWSDFQ